MIIKTIEFGTEFLDYETNTNVVYSLDNYKLYQHMVVKVLRKGRLKYGWVKTTKSKNIEFKQFSEITQELSTKKNNAISLDIFPEKNITWDNINGCYIFSTNEEYIAKINKNNNYTKGIGVYPYSISREYEASSNMHLFKSNIPAYPKVFDNSLTRLIPYTFGLEYETCAGIIPQELCFKTGLIPLRDGSISGNEYTSIVLDPSKSGFEIINAELEELKKYTEFNKECSLHIHFGNINLTPSNIYTLYSICIYLQDELKIFIPKSSFNTASYKNSRKDYCKYLPNYFKSFNKVYSWLSSNESPYLGSLECSHPRDVNRTSKWNINTRYYWVNFVNLCFYKSPKTLEFRVLRPTYNFNKIVNFIYIFSAIIKYCEDISKDVPLENVFNIVQSMFKSNLSIKCILNKVYPISVAEELNDFLIKCNKVVTIQTEKGDYIGARTDIEDEIITKNILK